MSLSVSHFDALVAAGAVHEALRLAFEGYEARGRREPGACFVRLRKIALELDARGALDEATWTEVEAIVHAARMPLDERLRVLREPRWPRVGVVAFPVVLLGLEAPVGALRWVEASAPVQGDTEADDPRVTEKGAREALDRARRAVTRVLPDADLLARHARLRITPDLPSNTRIRGGSLAAATLVALASLHLRREVSPTLAVTGELEGSRLRPVDERTLAVKRGAIRQWPRFTTFVAPGHPSLRDGSLMQIGDLEQPEELLTLCGLRWWTHVARDRRGWVDRTWREARNVEEWFFELVETNARLAADGNAIELERWVWLVERLRVALDEWQSRFVAGLRTEGLDVLDPRDDQAHRDLLQPPPVARGKELHRLSELRRRARDAIGVRRETLERLVASP